MNPAFAPLCAVLALASAQASASGFALAEQSASGLGNAFAGAAASAVDASTVWHNPAGLMLLKSRQLAVAAHVVRPRFEFDGTVAPAIGGGNGGDAGAAAAIPNAYLAMRLAPEMVFGVGVNVPFGLATEYDSDWKGRLHAIKSKLETLNLNPALAFRISDRFSVGAGANVQFARAALSNNAGGAGLATIKGDDLGYGWNVGALWQATPATRVGLAYRSQIRFRLEGDASFSLAAALNGPVHANLTLPDSASLSLVHAPAPRWELLADASWTDWSDFRELAIMRAAGTPLAPATPENWSDSWRYSLGVNWRASDGVTLRTGAAYDETPVADVFRTARIPDQNRIWLALGAQFRLGGASRVDIGYAHLFIERATLDETAQLAPVVLSGGYDASADILSAQYTLDL